jgi:hypothetical protein
MGSRDAPSGLEEAFGQAVRDVLEGEGKLLEDMSTRAAPRRTLCGCSRSPCSKGYSTCNRAA